MTDVELEAKKWNKRGGTLNEDKFGFMCRL